MYGTTHSIVDRCFARYISKTIY